MQKISITPNHSPNNAVSFGVAKNNRKYDPQAGVPMSKDSYVSSYKQQESKEQKKMQRTGIYALIGIAACAAALACFNALTGKNVNRLIKAQAELAESEIQQRSGSAAKNLAQTIYEDLSKDLAIKDMSLHSSLQETTKELINQISNYGEILGRGGKGTRSILLYGPPGTGKTTYAKAIAKEIPNTKFVALDVTKMKDKYVGETEKNLNALIDRVCEDAAAMTKKYNEELAKVIGEDLVKSGDKQAIEKAVAEAKAAGKKIPEQERIIVFIDEIDSVMMIDKSDSAKFSNDVLNEFKKGFTEKLGKQENVITIGATNLEIDAKKAMAGDGKTLDKPMLDRFASKIRVPNPDAKQIEDTIINHYKNAGLVDKELKEQNAKLTKLAKYLAKEEHDMSFRKLLGIFDKTANSTAGSGKNVTINDIKETLKKMKDEFHMNDSGINGI